MGEVKIRKWKIRDAESLQKNANNKSVSRFLLDRFPYPYTMESARNFLEFATNSQIKYLFAIEVNQELAGGIEIQLLTENYVNNGELGFWLGEAYWGQGIAKSAIVQITNKVFAETHITRIIAKTFGENIASQNLLLKCGFSKEAEFKDALLKDGKIYDECVFTLKRKNL